MKDEEVAKFMGGVTIELKNIYRSLDDMRSEMRVNNENANKTATVLRGILEEYQKVCRQEDLTRDQKINAFDIWKKDLIEQNLPKRIEKIETWQMKIAAILSVIGAAAAFIGGILHDYAAAIINGLIGPKI
jgi:2,3-bisphosphoglycerate-independent phosphoglycerate mutase